MSLQPIFLKLDNRPGLLVGAGNVALEKIGSILKTGLRLRVVAPQVRPEIRELAAEGKLQLTERPFELSDLDGNFIVITATDVPAVNQAVYAGALARNILCNSVDDIPNCDFFFGSVVSRGDLQIAISTAGESPAFAQRLRIEIDEQLPTDLGPWLANLGQLRREVLATHPRGEARKLLLHELANRQICDSPTCSARELARNVSTNPVTLTDRSAHEKKEAVILSEGREATAAEGPAFAFRSPSTEAVILSEGREAAAVEGPAFSFRSPSTEAVILSEGREATAVEGPAFSFRSPSTEAVILSEGREATAAEGPAFSFRSPSTEAVILSEGREATAVEGPAFAFRSPSAEAVILSEGREATAAEGPAFSFRSPSAEAVILSEGREATAAEGPAFSFRSPSTEAVILSEGREATAVEGPAFAFRSPSAEAVILSEGREATAAEGPAFSFRSPSAEAVILSEGREATAAEGPAFSFRLPSAEAVILSEGREATAAEGPAFKLPQGAQEASPGQRPGNSQFNAPSPVGAKETSIEAAQVHLVGAGPGDPELLTLRALRLIQSAQVILHDDLVPSAILSLAPPQAETVNVGKRCGTKTITQDEINTLMIEHARKGRTVVRLKSGDPLLFGRAAEEIEALAEAGIAYDIVPGVSAAFAAAAALGRSLTDRACASNVIFSTGHHAQSHNNAPLPQIEDATRVVYMPGRDLTLLAAQWLSEGLPADFPCAVVSHAAQPDQQVLHTTLGQLGEAKPTAAPSLLIAGWAVRTATTADLLSIEQSAVAAYTEPI